MPDSLQPGRVPRSPTPRVLSPDQASRISAVRPESGNGSLPPDTLKRYGGTLALAERTRTRETSWLPGQSLSTARNAHVTNTREQLEAALGGSFNYLEGDIRAELDPPHALEMRHDPVAEAGDNLTLAQWLELGVASGRGLKLDVKESSRMPDVLKAIQDAHADPARVMINLSFDAMEKWGDRIRAECPGVTLALNPPQGPGPSLDKEQVDALLKQAERLHGPATFVVRFDLLTPEALARLQKVAPVSVWNASDGPVVKDPADVARKLRDEGVAGVIDIRRTPGAAEKARGLWNRLRGEIETRLFHR